MLDEYYIRKTYDGKEGFKLIGKGGFGKVLLVKSKEGVKLALKVKEITNIEDLSVALNELMNLGKLSDHPNIMSYENCHLYKIPNKKHINQLFIEMSLATNTLENVLKTNKSLPEYEILEIIKQILKGLKHAHKYKKIAHLDLKPDNILIVDKKIKIADWGGSLRLRSLNSTKIRDEIFISKGYEAPELDQSNYYENEKLNYYQSDVYSLGMIILRLCGVSIKTLQNVPKGDEECHDLFLRKNAYSDLAKTYSKELLDLVTKMVAFDPSKRIRVDQTIEDLQNLFGLNFD